MDVMNESGAESAMIVSNLFLNLNIGVNSNPDFLLK